MFEDFFAEIDAAWDDHGPDRIQLRIIGCAALMLQTRYQRGTKDGDVFETLELTTATKQRLLQLAGSNSELHMRHRLYIDIVANGIPFLAHAPIWHPLDALNRRLKRFELFALDIIDVVVSKLKRFSANDQSDIKAMIDAGHVDHAVLVARFRAAVDELSGDARAADLDKHLANLHRVERDMLFVDETEIELPTKY